MTNQEIFQRIQIKTNNILTHIGTNNIAEAIHEAELLVTWLKVKSTFKEEDNE